MTSYHITSADRDYALDLTRRIKKAANNLWELLEEAWNSKVYASLGYKSWSAYISAEFDFSRQRAYQLVNQGAVIRQIKAGVSTDVNTPADVYVSEAEAREIKPVLPQVIEHAREQVEAGVPAQEAVRVAVQAARQPITRAPMDDEEPPEMLPIRQVEDCPRHDYVCVHCGDMLE